MKFLFFLLILVFSSNRSYKCERKNLLDQLLTNEVLIELGYNEYSKSIDLRNMGISSIPNGLFKDYFCLEELILSYNELDVVEVGYFKV
jgi:hypothetical protein